MEDVQTLLDMGFPKHHIQEALTAVEGRGLEAAVDWLVQRELDSPPRAKTDTLDTTDEEMECGEPKPGCSFPLDKPGTSKSEEKSDVSCGLVNSILCSDCGKLLRTTDLEVHIKETGHQNYAESTEEIKEKTEEEKKIALNRVQDIVRKRRIAIKEQEKMKEIELERNRRKAGQEMSLARERVELMDMQLAAQLKKKEKLEEKLARQRVLQEIEKDKLERKEKFSTAPIPPCNLATPEVSDKKPEVKTYETCRLLIRLTNGDCLTETFKANEELSAVRLYVDMNRTDGKLPFVFKTTFPIRVFTEEDMSTPLCALDLPPSATLILSKTM